MSDMKKAALERIFGILDEGSFVEIGAYVTGKNTAGCSDACMDGDGVVTGYGTVEGRLVYIYAQNPAVAGGSVGEMHSRKISNLYHMAVNMGAPLIAVADCAGIRLDEGNNSLFSFGKMFSHQAKASGVVPQIMAIFGNCGGGMSISASMADFVFMEKDARLFVNSPNAVAGNFEEKCDTSSSAFQAEKTGICDFTGTAEEICRELRELVAILPENNQEDSSAEVSDDDLNRSVAGIEALNEKAGVLRQIADDGRFTEIKKDHAEGICCGFIRLNGRTVGAVANQAPLLGHMEIKKAIKLISFCDAFSIPVLTLADVSGFARDLGNEIQLARALGKLTYTYANATVPMVTLVTGKAFGSAGLVMGSKSIGADMVYAWPDAKMGLMEKKLMDGLTGLNQEKDVYSALYNAQIGYLDDIIAPEETRQRIAAAFEMLYSKSISLPAKKHGTV